jgi:hypothetical protein
MPEAEAVAAVCCCEYEGVASKQIGSKATSTALRNTGIGDKHLMAISAKYGRLPPSDEAMGSTYRPPGALLPKAKH